MSGSYLFYGSIFEKCGNFWKKRPFFWADMAGLGSIGLRLGWMLLYFVIPWKGTFKPRTYIACNLLAIDLR